MKMMTLCKREVTVDDGFNLHNHGALSIASTGTLKFILFMNVFLQ
jgi:hypothetical protein